MLLLEKGLAESRHQAQGLIMSGKVSVKNVIQFKPGTLLPPDACIEVLAPSPFVGRGGVKLEHALNIFGVFPKGKICLDVGASTGGFTDCLLQQGAKKVYAVDVGKGQLSWKLRRNPGVVSLEKVNARTLSRKEIPEFIDLCTLDVSFISVRKILPALRILVREEGEFVVLFKPQFEAAPKQVNRGIIRKKEVHQEVLENFVDWLNRNNFTVENLTYSPITGADGNIEFFVHLRSRDQPSALHDRHVRSLVGQAHERLGSKA